MLHPTKPNPVPYTKKNAKTFSLIRWINYLEEISLVTTLPSSSQYLVLKSLKQNEGKPLPLGTDRNQLYVSVYITF